jgi:cell division protein FtsQ
VWDNPRLLNLASNTLFAVAMTLFAYAGLQMLLRSPLFPVKEIVVRGDLKKADHEEIANALDGVGGNFFAADLAAVRGRLEQVGWVRRVEARRVWPDRIEVRLEEHVAFARWGDSGFVNSYGEPFAAGMDAAEKGALPQLAGPEGTEAEVARRFQRFTELLAPLGEKPERVLLSPRHAWQLRLENGLQVELGRDGAELVEQRLERFVAAYPATLGQLGRSKYERVDLRYPNGFALRVTGWKG